MNLTQGTRRLQISLHLYKQTAQEHIPLVMPRFQLEQLIMAETMAHGVL